MIVDEFRTRLNAFLHLFSQVQMTEGKRRIDNREYIGYWHRKNNYKYNSFHYIIYIKINDDITKQRNVMIDYACIDGNERCRIVHNEEGKNNSARVGWRRWEVQRVKTDSYLTTTNICCLSSEHMYHCGRSATRQSKINVIFPVFVRSWNFRRWSYQIQLCNNEEEMTSQ